MPWDIFAVLGLMAFILICLFSLWHLRSNYVFLSLVMSYALVVFFVGPVVSHDMPRYYLFSTPLICIILGNGMTLITPRYVSIGLAALLFVSWCKADINYFTGRDFHVMAHVDPWREVSEFLHQRVAGDDRIMIKTSYSLGSYYLPGIGLKDHVIADYSQLDLPESRVPSRLWLIVNNPSSTQSGLLIQDDLKRRFGFRVHEVAHFLKDNNYKIKSRYFKKDFAEFRVDVFQLQR
ncbi:hypothetical protein EG832_06715 [bacterium]|nr:hypothetical protein [bacterium]